MLHTLRNIANMALGASVAIQRSTFLDQRCGKPTMCAISVVNAEHVCFNTLGDAVLACPPGGAVRLDADITTKQEVLLDKGIEFIGCISPAPRITADFGIANITRSAIFRTPVSWEAISLINLAFEPISSLANDSFATVLRTPELGNGEWPGNVTTGPVSLLIDRCTFRNFKTYARGGSVIFLGRAGNVTIVDSVFENNIVMDGGRRWDGGGAVWIRESPADESNIIVRGCTFRSNKHYFPHSQGAALFCGYCLGDVIIYESTFEDNVASGGGAVYMQDSSGMVIIANSTFVRNHAHEWGWGSRGGALWLQYINGEVDIDGVFDNNTASSDRGAVLASNAITGRLRMKGVFLNNYAAVGGSVVDVHGSRGLSHGGEVLFGADSVFEGNYPSELIRTSVTQTHLVESNWTGQAVRFVSDP